jgi:hypothetical protein
MAKRRELSSKCRKGWCEGWKIAAGVCYKIIIRSRFKGVYVMPNGSDRQENDTASTVAARWPEALQGSGETDKAL